MKLSEKRLLKKVEAGFCHAYATAFLGPRETKWAASMAARGYLRLLPAGGRWPERYVVTSSGSWTLGSFDSDDRHFYADSRAASRAAKKEAS